MHMFGPRPRDPFEELPIDTYVDAVTLNSGANGFLKIVVMSNNATTSYSVYKEYHHIDTATSINGISSFNLCCSALKTGTQTEITNYINGMPQQFVVPQAPTWQRGVFSPTAARARLYKATDPDDSTKQIGLLLEQDSSGQLVRATWYKTQDATAIFRSPQSSLSFSLVTNSGGSASTDPNDIGGWTWYYTT